MILSILSTSAEITGKDVVIVKKEVFQSCLFVLCGVLWWGFLYPDLNIIPGETVELSEEDGNTYSEESSSEELVQMFNRFLDGEFTSVTDEKTEKIIIKSRLVEFLQSMKG